MVLAAPGGVCEQLYDSRREGGVGKNVHVLPLLVNDHSIAVTTARVGLGTHQVVESTQNGWRSRWWLRGLTIVAFGSSASEFVVNLIAAFMCQGDISRSFDALE